MYVGVPMHTHRPGDNLHCHYPGTTYFVFMRQRLSLAWSSPRGQVGWPESPRALPVPTSLVLGLQAYAIMPGFLNLGPEDETQVLVLVRQVFCPLSHVGLSSLGWDIARRGPQPLPCWI